MQATREEGGNLIPGYWLKGSVFQESSNRKSGFYLSSPVQFTDLMTASCSQALILPRTPVWKSNAVVTRCVWLRITRRPHVWAKGELGKRTLTFTQTSSHPQPGCKQGSQYSWGGGVVGGWGGGKPKAMIDNLFHPLLDTISEQTETPKMPEGAAPKTI